MDNDWTCLVEDMWESYLCEENIGASSFYDVNSDDPLSSIFDAQFDQLYPFEEAELFRENNEQLCPNDEDLQPLGNIFQLMEDAALFNHDKLEDDESNAIDPKMTSCQEDNKKKEAGTNTRKMKTTVKSKTEEKQKRKEVNYKKSHQRKKQQKMG